MSVASIYIPRVLKSTSESSLREAMIHGRIGSVSRVDFTVVNKKAGFCENDADEKYVSVFIHFYKINKYNRDFWDFIENDQSVRINFPDGSYWICLKNKNPVKDTLMNIHQVVEAGVHLEKIVEEQANRIAKLEEQIEKLLAREH